MKTMIKLTLVLSAFAGVGCGGSSDTTTATKGPGAALTCKSSGKNAFDTYSATAFVAVNEQIFSNVVAELGGPNGTTKLGTSFNAPASNPTELARFKGSLAAFLVYAYGGPSSITYTDGKTYTGPQDMAAKHASMAITDAQYDYFVANIIVPALTAKGVPADDVSSCFAPVVTDAAFKASIVGK